MKDIEVSDGTDRRVDIAVALFLIVVCAIGLFETRSLPPGTFEPLGSAPVPQAVAGLIILLCLVVIVRALRRPPAEPDGLERSWLDAGAVILFTLAYAAAMHFRLASFAILTTAFLTVCIGALVRFRPKSMPVVLIVALATGFGCQYVFTRVFIVDLPGL